MKKLILPLVLVLLLCACTPPQEVQTGQATETPVKEETVDAYENNGYNVNYLCGVDHFGRAFMPVSGMDESKHVGMFYFLWHGEESKGSELNITQLLEEHPEDLWNIEGTDLSPVLKFYYWDEPLFGYYRSDDRWVIAKHIEMLTAAGVDFLYLDATNGNPYLRSAKALFNVLLDFQARGWDAPKVVFYTNSRSIPTITTIYNEFYTDSKYDSIWYRPDGVRPMIIGNATVELDKGEAALRDDYNYNPDPLSKEIEDLFDIRVSQWPNAAYNYYGFPWMEWSYPQPLHNGVMNVSLSQHPQIPFSDSIKDRSKNWGRGYNFTTKENVAEDAQEGSNAQSQWDTVIKQKDKIHTVTVTGWNEWVALKLIMEGRVFFVDTMNEEFSRDIEMQKNGGYEDAFYLQLCDNIRRFKGEQDKIRPADSAIIDVQADISQWDNIRNSYVAGTQRAYSRAAYSVAKTYKYSMESPRNNIQEVKVTNAGDTLSFMVRCEKEITSADQTDFMNIWIGTGKPSIKGWESYEYVLSANDGVVYALDAEGKRTKVAQGQVSVKGEYLQATLSLSDIGAPQDGVYFKVTDGVEVENIMQTYTDGKCVPMGRLSYYYYLAK